MCNYQSYGQVYFQNDYYLHHIVTIYFHLLKSFESFLRKFAVVSIQCSFRLRTALCSIGVHLSQRVDFNKELIL
jgi:hypothetical protein